MQKKIKALYLFIFIIILTCSLCACTGYTEIENMDILTSHFVYKNGPEIQLGGGVANVRGFSDSMADKPVSYISASAPTLSEASKKLHLAADHKLFYGGIRALVIGDEYAKEGIGEFFEYIQTLPDHRPTVSVFTSPEKSRDIVEYTAINDFTGGFAAESLVNTLQKQKEMINCSLSDIWEARLQGDVGFVLPDIKIKDGVMSVAGYSIFDSQKKIAYTDIDKGRAINYILSKKAKGDYILTMPDGKTCAITVDMKNKKLSVSERAENILEVTGDFKFDITAHAYGANDLTEEYKEYIKAEIPKLINAELLEVFNLSKKYGCDFLKLYEAYQRKNRSRFYTLNWSNMIKSMDIKINVESGFLKNYTVR